MELMMRRSLLQSRSRLIGGLPVLYNNALYPNGNGMIDGYTPDSDYFISGIIDTGSLSPKKYTIYQQQVSGQNSHIRYYDDTTAQSVDFWGNYSANPSVRMYSSAGRYIAISVLKADAKKMFVYDNDSGLYLIKGEDVPDKVGDFPVLVDNAIYDRNGLVFDTIAAEGYCLIGPFDTGSAESKSFTCKQVPSSGAFRIFNNLSSNSYDYWYVSGNENTPRTLTTSGRYVVYPIKKSEADDAYMYDNTNQRYVFKGKNVA